MRLSDATDMSAPARAMMGRTALAGERLHPDFGLRVCGLDLAKPLSDRDAQALRHMLDAYGVLVVPRQRASAEKLVTFARTFGDPETVKVGSAGAGRTHSSTGNVCAKGQIAAPDSRLGMTSRANQQWHSDGSYKARPPLASMLHARIVPREGGTTEFASMRAAWARLPIETQAMLKDAVCVHSYATSRDRISKSLMNQAERDALPPVRHDAMRHTGPGNVPTLYLGAHVGDIVGWDTATSERFVQNVLSLATEEEAVYRHEWSVGDVVVWDNRSMIHRGRPWDLSAARHLIHVSVSEPGGDA